MTTTRAPLKKFLTPINRSMSSDWGILYNMCIGVYRKNVAVSKENKFNMEMDEFIYNGDRNHVIMDLREVTESKKMREGEMSATDLHKRVNNPLALSSIYLRHSEACRKMAWATIRQNYPLTLKALTEFSEVEQDIAELTEEVGTSLEYLSFQNRVMKEYNDNKERVVNWKNDGYYDYRFQGQKIYKCC